MSIHDVIYIIITVFVMILSAVGFTWKIRVDLVALKGDLNTHIEAEKEHWKRVENKCDSNCGTVVEIQRTVDRMKEREKVRWEANKEKMEKTLHSPKHVRRDELVLRLKEGEMTKEEVQELLPLLQDAAIMERGGKAIAAMFFLDQASKVLADFQYQRHEEVSYQCLRKEEGTDDCSPVSPV